MSHAAPLAERSPSFTVEPGPRARLIEHLDSTADFNFRHFRIRHMAAELLRTGLPIGSEAPEFDMPASDGTRIRLSDLRGRPAVLHFISYTCPVTRGGVQTMRELHRLYGAHVRFLEILVRQAHPGGRHGAYGSESARSADAREYVREEHPSWPVLVDDLAGTVQRAYGGLAAAAYLIDRDGRVAFCGTWGQSPALRVAIDDLLARGGSGAPAGKGSDRRPHLAAAIVAGQRGPLSGGHRAIIDLELGFPGAVALMTLGRLGRPLLAPLVIRTTPVPKKARTALVAGLLVTGLIASLDLHRRRRPRREPHH